MFKDVVTCLLVAKSLGLLVNHCKFSLVILQRFLVACIMIIVVCQIQIQKCVDAPCVTFKSEVRDGDD